MRGRFSASGTRRPVWGPARALAGACGPLIPLLLLFLSLVVVPLDGEEHASAEHENLERDEDDRDPIHHFLYFRAVA